MPYFPNLNIKYLSIPGTGSEAIVRTLLKFELFEGLEQEEDVYNSIIYSKKFVKKEEFKHLQLWELFWKYPDAFDAKDFTVIRHPYDRIIAIFFDLINTSQDFKKFKIEKNDSVKIIQEKFEKFVLHFKMFKNFNQGIGIEHIEYILSELNYPEKQKMALHFLRNNMFTDTRFSLQMEMIRSDHRQHLRFFKKKESMDFNKIKIIKYENLKSGLLEFDPVIFSNISCPYKSFKKQSGITYPSNYFFNKLTKKLIAEYYEPDFYHFHYNPDIELV